MLKILGCMLLFSGCTALGFIKAETYRNRRIELTQTLEIIRLLRIDMTYKGDKLQKAFRHLGKAKNCWFCKMLIICADNMDNCTSLQGAWQAAVDGEKNIPLKDEDLEILNDVFSGIGKSDIKGQESIFQPAMIRLDQACSKAAAEETRQGRMFKALGSFAGITLVILLI